MIMEQTFIEKIVQEDRIQTKQDLKRMPKLKMRMMNNQLIYSNGLFYYFSRITKKNRILKNSCSTRRSKISSSGRGEKGERRAEEKKRKRVEEREIVMRMARAAREVTKNNTPQEYIISS